MRVAWFAGEAGEGFSPPHFQRADSDRADGFVFPHEDVKVRQADAEDFRALIGVHEKRRELRAHITRPARRVDLYAIFPALPFLLSSSMTIVGPLNFPAHFGIPPFCVFM